MYKQRVCPPAKTLDIINIDKAGKCLTCPMSTLAFLDYRRRASYTLRSTSLSSCIAAPVP